MRTNLHRIALRPALAFLVALPSLAQPTPNSVSPSQTWITNVTILSPEDLDHLTVGTVVIESGRILRIEHTASAKPPAGASVISGKDQYLVPGLIDSHVHLVSVPGMNTDQRAGKE